MVNLKFVVVLLTAAMFSPVGGQTATGSPEVSYTRIKLYRSIQQQLEAYFDTGDSDLWQAARAMAEAAVENFQDSFYVRQCDKYRFWRNEKYELRSREKGRFRDLLASLNRDSGLDLLAGSFGTVADRFLELGDSAAAVSSLHYQANLTSQSSSTKYALTFCQQALEVSRRSGDFDGQARSYNLSGRLYEKIGEFFVAGAYFDSARVLKVLLDDIPGIADCLSNMSSVYLSLGERAKSEAYALEALRLRRQQGDTSAVVSSLLTLITVFGRETEIDSVNRWLDECESPVGSLRDPVLQVRLLQAQGVGLERRGELDSALAKYHNAAKAAKSLGQSRMLFTALQGSAAILLQLGEFTEGIRALLDAKSLAEEQRNFGALASVLHSLGSAYQQAGDLDAAREYYLLSLAARREHNLVGNNAGTLLNLAELYLAATDTANAQTALSQADVEAHIAGADAEVSAVWVVRARLYAAAGRYDEALGALDSARAAYRTGIPQRRKSDLLYLKIDLLRRARRWKQIDSLLDTMMSSTLRCPLTECARKLTVMGQVRFDRGDYRNAILDLTGAIKNIEALRGELPDIQLRSGFLAQSRNVYELLVHAYYRNGEAPDNRPGSQSSISATKTLAPNLIDSILCYIEKAKSRGLLDALRAGGSRSKPATSPAESKLVHELDQIAKALATNTDVRACERLAAREDAISQQLSQLRRERVARGTAGQSAYQPPPLAIDSLQRALPDDRTALLSYLLTPDGSYLIVINRTESQICSLANRETITRAVQSYSRLVQTSIKDESLLDSLPLAARELALLIFPASFDPTRYDHLVIAADGALHLLPFEALRIGERFLVEQCAVTRIPSLYLYGGGESKAATEPKRRLLAIADPRPKAPMTPLEYSRQEVEWIAELHGSTYTTVLDSAAATKGALRNLDLGSFARIHIASHSTIDYDDPTRSRIWLSADTSGEYLTTADIEAWPLDAKLVVLSSCESGGGRFELGEGLDGFARAFYSAGARNLVLSLWEVEDFATAGFMRSFYRDLDQGAAQAMRGAKLEMIHSPRLKHRHPWYWSAFILTTAGTGASPR